jgi:recombination protein RecT
MSYRGAEKLARKYSIKPIKSIVSDIVRDGDDFQMEIKDNDVKVNFKPKMFNRADIVGVFAYVVFEDGTAVAETMNIDEINTTRSKSKASNGDAWKLFFPEMAKKSVIKRLMKRVEIDFENPEQATFYNEDMAIATEPEDVIDSVSVEVEENANQIPFNPED